MMIQCIGVILLMDVQETLQLYRAISVPRNEVWKIIYMLSATNAGKPKMKFGRKAQHAMDIPPESNSGSGSKRQRESPTKSSSVKHCACTVFHVYTVGYAQET